MASPIPNAYVQFIDNRGNPLSNGTVNYYAPGTTTPKQTWRDPGLTVTNANPVVLDSNGRAPIFGTGSYRQQVKAANGTVIFDGTTSLNDGYLPLATELSGMTFDDQVQIVRTGGFATHGKGGANYVRMAAAPSTGEQQAGLNRWLFRSNANTVWWRLAEDEPTDLMFGVTASASASSANGLLTITGPDDTIALQAAFHYLTYFAQGSGRRLRMPAGLRRITNTLHLGYGDKYMEWQIDGDSMYGFNYNSGYSSGILADFNDRPAINIQAARMARLSGIAIYGVNHAWLVANEQTMTDRAPLANWRGPQMQAATVDTRYAPYCAIAVDGYSGTRHANSSYPNVDYPAWTQIVGQYDKGASSNIEFRDVTGEGFEVGIAVQPNLMPTASNGDFMHFTSCNLGLNLVGASISHSDARVVCFDRAKLHGCRTAFDSVTYGSGTGNVAASFANCSFDRVYRILNVDLGISVQPFAPAMVFTNVYAEGIYSLGTVRTSTATGRPGAIRFIGGELGFGLRSGEFVPNDYLDGRAEVIARFEDVSFHGTFGIMRINCDVEEFSGSFPALSYQAVDQTTLGGRRAASVLCGIDAPQIRSASVNPFVTFGLDTSANFTARCRSHGFDLTVGGTASGAYIPLFVRSIGYGNFQEPIAAAPEEVLDRATYPLTSVTQAGVEWTFSVSGAFLSDPANPACCIGAGDIVRDEGAGTLFYVKTASFAGSGQTLSITLTLRQLTAIRSSDGITWQSNAILSANQGAMRFRCARRVVAGTKRRLAMNTVAGSSTVSLVAIGPETFAGDDLGSGVRTLAVGDYLVPSDRGAASLDNSVFAKGRITALPTSGGVPTGSVTFDSTARRNGLYPTPLFIKAG